MRRKSSKNWPGVANAPRQWKPAPHAWRIPVTAAVLGGLCVPAGLVLAENKKPRKTAVQAVMDRQILNAVDAGDGDLVTRSLRHKVVSEPDNTDARLALGLAYEKLGADELAIEHYRTAAFQYGSEKAASRLARTLDSLGESEQAVSVLVQFCGSHAGASSRILSELGILEDETGRMTAGEHHHRRALAAALTESAARQDALHNNLGYNLLAQKRFAEAEEQLREALDLNPRSETARSNLAFALSASPAATSAQVNEAILQWQSLSGPAAAHNNLAAVYLEQGRYPEARRELERALEFEASNAAALKNWEALAVLDGKPAPLPVATAPAVAAASAKKPNFWHQIFVRKRRSTAGADQLAAGRKNLKGSDKSED